MNIDIEEISKIFVDFIMNIPDDVVEKVKKLNPRISEEGIKNELTGLRYSVVDMFLYIKLKDDLNLKNELFKNIKDGISTMFETTVGKEGAESFQKFLSERRMRYAIVLDDDPNKLPYICVQFAEYVGIDIRKREDDLKEVAKVYTDTVTETMKLIADLPKETQTKMGDIEEEEEISSFPRNRVIKTEITMFLIALAGAYACFKYFSIGFIGKPAPIILGVITLIMLFRQLTRIRFISIPGMIQEKGKLVVSSFAIVILFIVSFFF